MTTKHGENILESESGQSCLVSQIEYLLLTWACGENNEAGISMWTVTHFGDEGDS